MRARMAWRTMQVDGRPASYGVAGDGPPVVFLHGWGLSHRTYRHGLERLVGHGVRVLAPALPGFAGTAPLPDGSFTLQGVRRVGGGLPRRVRRGRAGHPGRPLLRWRGGAARRPPPPRPGRPAGAGQLHRRGGVVQPRRAARADGRPADVGLGPAHRRPRPVGAVLHPGDAGDRAPTRCPTSSCTPPRCGRSGGLARDADLAAELEELKERGLPVVIVWGRDDTVIPWACAESLAVALGKTEVVTVPGNHSWLLADPGRFAEIITNVIGIETDEETQAS